MYQDTENIDAVLPIYTTNLQYILTSLFQFTQISKLKIGILVWHQFLRDNVPIFNLQACSKIFFSNFSLNIITFFWGLFSPFVAFWLPPSPYLNENNIMRLI